MTADLRERAYAKGGCRSSEVALAAGAQHRGGFCASTAGRPGVARDTYVRCEGMT